MDIIRFEFRKTRSPKFKTAVMTAKELPNYSEEDEVFSARIDNVKDFCYHLDEILKLTQIVYQWKGATVFFYDTPYKTANDYHTFFEKLKREAGKYSIILSHPSEVGLDAVTIEKLPMPVVYYPSLYGAFIGFAPDVEEPMYFCECERKPVENFFKLTVLDGKVDTWALDKTFPKVFIDEIKGSRDYKSHLRFKDNLCFKCNHTTPKKKYCLPMYGEQFKQMYGWYINQEYYTLGIDRYSRFEKIIEEDCPPEILEAIQQIKLIQDGQATEYDQGIDTVSLLRQEIDRAVENSAREKLGFKKVGESWVSETIMFNILEGIYGKKSVIRHHRPDWLDGLELDAFVPAANTGFEYQGIQHFKAVEHWGGESKLRIQQEHDEKKKKICSERGVNLICINFDEPLTKEHILFRIEELEKEIEKERTLWKPDQERLYIMECLDDPRFFLHNELLIWPVLYEEKPGTACFTYCLNRGHAFQGDVEKMTDDTLQIHCTEAGAHENHTFLIRPMNEDDFQRKKKKLHRRDDWPHTHKELFEAYVEEAGWG